jgi:hypothetical protein
MVTPSAVGSPTRTFSVILAWTASITCGTRASGTSARRMAVHFWPALAVISVTSCRMNRSNSALPGDASAPSREKFSESASELNRTPPLSTAGCVRRVAAVDAEPVKATVSCSVSRSSRPRDPPATSCRLPSGNNPVAMISRATASAR